MAIILAVNTLVSGDSLILYKSSSKAFESLMYDGMNCSNCFIL
jgi:hypothetical protein